jgi:hypothetical protein
MKRGTLAIFGVSLAAVFTTWLPAAAPGPLFLIDDTHRPTVTISWPTASGSTTTMAAELPWTSPNERTSYGRNLEGFAALGGTRLDTGAGNPNGAVVRTGFYKADNAIPMFEDLAQNATITITMTNILFMKPATPRPATALQHLKYMPEDAAACGLGDTGLDQYNTASLTDTLNGKITIANARMGVLDGQTAGGGTVSFTQAESGEITMTAVLPYSLFRHVRDPWQRTNPGTFFEPTHFHVEVEVLPVEVAAELDAEAASGIRQ